MHLTDFADFPQVLVDGPASKEVKGVPRQSAPLNHLQLSHIVIPKLPRAAGRGAVARAWGNAKVQEQWEESASAKRKAQQDKRRNLTDFERFKVLRLKKQVSGDSIPPDLNQSSGIHYGLRTPY